MGLNISSAHFSPSHSKDGPGLQAHFLNTGFPPAPSRDPWRSNYWQRRAMIIGILTLDCPQSTHPRRIYPSRLSHRDSTQLNSTDVRLQWSWSTHWNFSLRRQICTVFLTVVISLLERNVLYTRRDRAGLCISPSVFLDVRATFRVPR